MLPPALPFSITFKQLGAESLKKKALFSWATVRLFYTILGQALGVKVSVMAPGASPFSIHNGIFHKGHCLQVSVEHLHEKWTAKKAGARE